MPVCKAQRVPSSRRRPSSPRLPSPWLTPSRPLRRCAQLADWCEKGLPKVFWLAGFTYPTGFLTALMQVVIEVSVIVHV